MKVISGKEIFNLYNKGKFKFKQIWGNGYCILCKNLCSRKILMGTQRVVYIHKECQEQHNKDVE